MRWLLFLLGVVLTFSVSALSSPLASLILSWYLCCHKTECSSYLHAASIRVFFFQCLTRSRSIQVRFICVVTWTKYNCTSSLKKKWRCKKKRISRCRGSALLFLKTSPIFSCYFIYSICLHVFEWLMSWLANKTFLEMCSLNWLWMLAFRGNPVTNGELRR